ncbi:(2Fe-2S)-binding protein [Pseudonocardia sp. KRD-184]|uniref:(2Fe-2S)-binding protein n=2 Tax=Pseudonocardia oceani TaxID=2792013 RepID=A0ABS6UIG2_9PSEU|nr:(2Fe-2S)-binding protein [Pseudonocardia oceani]MCX6464148.1 (2Fe-2S)-binding protein [Pseudonocardiales bacterium]MBW0099630.1 (2Fe-2S)-binding protein [Pseudonocardia oceani]MBW0111116.1 (2Fe-2S)-binding protein [Pseudonocardia oceani]MBW0122090.1 (2Fe-2S)-binding protein [Pseudonocardia oceani]
MYVCMCFAVCDRQIRSCIGRGARTVEEVGEATEAGTGCGGCQGHIDTLLTAALAPSELSEMPATA